MFQLHVTILFLLLYENISIFAETRRTDQCTSLLMSIRVLQCVQHIGNLCLYYSCYLRQAGYMIIWLYGYMLVEDYLGSMLSRL